MEQQATKGEVEARELSKDADALVDGSVLPEERKRTFRTPGFSRMTLEWSSHDREVIRAAKDAVDGHIIREFQDAYEIMYRIYDLVRTPEVTADGEIVKDRFGYTVWKRSPTGEYLEDWSRLMSREKEDLLFRITTRMMDWEQRSANLWGEAMMAKARWEERYAITFDAPIAGTVDDRRSKGNMNSADERYFAIYTTWLSRRAEALVKAMNLLGQRLKDSLLIQ
jgi:hypothetical protein